MVVARVKVFRCPDCKRELALRGEIGDEEAIAAAEKHGWKKSRKTGFHYCWICVMRRRRKNEKAESS